MGEQVLICDECGKRARIMLTLEAGGDCDEVHVCSRCYVGGRPLTKAETVKEER